MDLISKLQSGVDRLARTSYFREMSERQARAAFLSNRDQNLFFGVYDSWQAASDAAAGCGQVGYDNDASAALYDHRTRMDTHDYPALCWLLRSMQEGLRSVGDIGGSIGIKFIAFRDALAAWPDLQWTVHDVPAATAHGRELSAARGDSGRLHFVDTFAGLQDCEILYASGVLQYLPETLGDCVANFRNRPKRIIINTTPLHPSTAFFTVNSLGTAFCPYRVQTQAVVVRELTKLGYRVRESWTNPDKRMIIPFHREHSLTHYSGLCLDRQG